MHTQTQIQLTEQQKKNLANILTSSLDSYLTGNCKVGAYKISEVTEQNVEIVPTKFANIQFSPKTISLQSLEVYEPGVQQKIQDILSA